MIDIRVKECEFCGRPKKPDGQPYCNACSDERRQLAIKLFYGSTENMRWVDLGNGYAKFERIDEVSSQTIPDELDALFKASKTMNIEQGMIGPFGERFIAIMKRDTPAVIAWFDKAFDDRTINNIPNHDAIGAALYYLSDDYTSPVNMEERRLLLEKMLTHEWLLVRSEAASALSSINDLRSIPVLEAARDAENDPFWKKDFQQVIDCIIKYQPEVDKPDVTE